MLHDLLLTALGAAVLAVARAAVKASVGRLVPDGRPRVREWRVAGWVFTLIVTRGGKADVP